VLVYVGAFFYLERCEVEHGGELRRKRKLEQARQEFRALEVEAKELVVWVLGYIHGR